MDDHLRSDEVRDILYESDDDEDRGSQHNSDIASNIGEQFENELREELGADYYDQLSDYELDAEAVPDTAYEGNEEGGAAEPLQEEGEWEDFEVDGDDWRDWNASDSKFNKFIWAGDSGYKPPRGKSPETPLELFQLFFDDNLLTEIVKETNRYASEKIQMKTPLQKRSMWWSWKDMTLPELKAFLGVLLNMGMHDKPELDDYFSTEWVDYQPFFKDVFSKERFLQLFWNLHVSPPPSGPIAGTLTRSGKIRNVVAYLDQKFRMYYVPKKKVSVDESTVGYKGRVVFKVYNKDKPTKWGIKIFVLAESSSGYICAMEPYFGKITTDRMARQDLGTTSRIVLHLVNKLKASYPNIEGMHVFTDRFYTNLDLAAALHDMKIHTTGTVMTNRKGLPEQVRSKKKVGAMKLKKGDIKSFRKQNKFSVLLWQDTKFVAMLTTLYDNTTQKIRRMKKNGESEEVEKPTVVCKYNKSMGGVDLADQYISSYSFTRKSIKWWRKIFFWLLETAVVNSYILYKKTNQGQKAVRQRKFRKMLVKELVGEVRNANKRGRPSNIEEDERLNGKLHLPYPLDGGKTKDCIVCSDRRAGKERKRSKFYCKTCTNQPGLHIGLCFERYHSLKKFKN